MFSLTGVLAGAIECLAGHPKYAAAIIRHRGVLALVGLLNAGTREAFLPTMRALKELSGNGSKYFNQSKYNSRTGLEVICKHCRMAVIAFRLGKHEDSIYEH